MRKDTFVSLEVHEGFLDEIDFRVDKVYSFGFSKWVVV